MFAYNEESDLLNGEIVIPISLNEDGDKVICKCADGTEKEFSFEDFDFEKDPLSRIIQIEDPEEEIPEEEPEVPEESQEEEPEEEPEEETPETPEAPEEPQEEELHFPKEGTDDFWEKVQEYVNKKNELAKAHVKELPKKEDNFLYNEEAVAELIKFSKEAVHAKNLKLKRFM